MNVLDMVLEQGGGALVKQLATQFGLNEAQIRNAAQSLVPILAGALVRNMGRSGGLDSLLDALGKGQHDRYIDDASALNEPATRNDGDKILEKLLGDKSVSREAAQRSAEKTGLGADVLKQLLPMLAAAVMGGLSKQTKSKRRSGRRSKQAEQDGLFDMLTPLLDRDQDGAVMDDILAMAGRFLSGR